MGNTQSKIVGYGFLTVLSVILFVPFADYLNANIPAGTIGDALGSFFWLVYPMLIIYLIYKLLDSLLYG